MKLRPSLRGKLILAVLVTTLVFLSVNLVLFRRMNVEIGVLEGVYATNVSLNELGQALSDAQSASYEYLNTRGAQALQAYEQARGLCETMIGGMSGEISDQPARLLERNIRSLCISYLEQLDAAVAGKAAFDAALYTASYGEAEDIYADLLSCIRALDALRFEANSANYSVLVQSLHSLEWYMVCILVCVAAYIIVLLYAIMGGIIRPLVRLSEKASEIAQGNFGVALDEPRGEDEVSTVTCAFNRMVVSINEHIRRTRESLEAQLRMKENELAMEKLLKDARLKYYQAQIDPHFLFNTLNAGEQLAMMEGAERTYTFLDNLAAFCRCRIGRSGEHVTLREEVALVDNYMYIMNVRYGGEIRLTKRIDERLLSLPCPGMVLQPIVENAVRYGLADKEEDKRIELSIRREGAGALISVRDNGRGIAPAQLERILSAAPEPQQESGGNGVGLRNVRARLRLYDEREDVLTIRSEGEGMGTEVILRVRAPREEACTRS